jgi:uncharacterized protein (DUF1778 family)
MTVNRYDRKVCEQTILDQRLFFLEPKEHDQFLAQLDAPVSPAPSCARC